MSEHTPGPWYVAYGCVSDADEGFGIGSKIEPGFGVIAECWPCTTTLETRRTLAANARLIAAAPDMLAACKAAVRCIALNTPIVDSSHPLGRIADEMDRVREMIGAAIAKAEAH